MRTTLTLEEDVAAKIEQEMRRSGKSLKQIVNEHLRLAFNTRREQPSSRRFVVRPQRMGSVPGLNYDNIGELLEQLEGPGHK